MLDRDTFERIKEKHGGYASWAVWAHAGSTPKSNIGDLRVLDPDLNPTLLEILRNDVIMLGLNISRAGIVVEPFRNFHDASPKGQDFKIRYAFEGTPCYGAYMTDFIKDVVMLDRASLLRHVRGNPQVKRQSVERLLGEFNDLQCDKPTILTFGDDTYAFVADSVPDNKYSRLIPIMHYAHYISKEEYRRVVLQKIEAHGGC